MNRALGRGLALGAGSLLAYAAGRAALRRSRDFNYRDKTALITGGSRGLGLVIARRLVDQGARVALLARTQADLEVAAEELRARGGVVSVHPCDVSDKAAVERAVADAAQQHPSIDLLFNVAGVIEVGPFDAMRVEDFHKSMATNCWGILHTVIAVLPHMRRRRWGRIVNIASLGGKRAVPHMLPYCVSKFAAVGLSHGLRTELAKHGVLVTTVCPSLMRTGSPRNALFKGQHRKEYAWFSIGDSLSFTSMEADAAAQQILQACRHGRAELIARDHTNLGVVLQNLLPGVTREVLTAADRLLPEMGGIGRQAARGHESTSGWSPSWLTRLSEQAARRNNQMRDRSPSV
ncbi:Fatty acyl-CoA reductase [Pseudobythopirellula maris]|uniref:Fatty acyl-CoA reductase n=1 Tax=Pseudobythopirellula maris TaxID=2527991 RepID=A0A5C5ZPZ9_9BACT|nr:SDR family oxidoreductase [Pseudobythopirellula maris]TWT88997.1 Fatty acyl-CoA reductase [Pseudobythopirellula maris]